jgi:hypothetical protein
VRLYALTYLHNQMSLLRSAPFRCVASYKFLAPTELLFNRHLAL